MFDFDFIIFIHGFHKAYLVCKFVCRNKVQVSANSQQNREARCNQPVPPAVVVSAIELVGAAVADVDESMSAVQAAGLAPTPKQ